MIDVNKEVLAATIRAALDTGNPSVKAFAAVDALVALTSSLPVAVAELADNYSEQLTRAKNLLVRLYDKHPETRPMIEGSTSSWFVWGTYRNAAQPPKPEFLPSPPVPAGTPPAQPEKAGARDIIEMLCRGLVWNIENHPTAMNERDAEALATAREFLATPPVTADQLPQAWADVLAERRRQVEAEDWTPEHDDEHAAGELAQAAACYALGATFVSGSDTDLWPWDREAWKPTNPRRMLVKSCALGLAEIERLDRAAVFQGAEVAEPEGAK